MKFKIGFSIFAMLILIFIGFLLAYLQNYFCLNKEAVNLYEDWRSRYVEVIEPNLARVHDPEQDSVTVSEGIGYGMLFAVMHDDKETFDALYEYCKKFRNENGFMNWKISRYGEIIGLGAATDAEEDIAYSLYLAYKKWEEEGYLTEAILRINKIQQFLVNADDRILPGDEWGNTNAYNPSYVTPEYYLCFYEITEDERWIHILETNIEYLSEIAQKETGLFPDWINFETENHTIFGYESVRVPIRLYQFIKNESDHDASLEDSIYLKAKDIMKRQAKFAKEQTYQGFLSEYQVDGSGAADYQSNAFLSSGLAMLRADDQNSYRWGECLKARESENYYGDSLRLWILSLYQDAETISK